MDFGRLYFVLSKKSIKNIANYRCSANLDFIFEGFGSAPVDDVVVDQYGGVVFAYNTQVVRLWAPTRNNASNPDKTPTGYIIYINDGWGNEKNVQTSHEALVKVRAWK